MHLTSIVLDCKTVRIFAYSYTREQLKVWNEAENRERGWGETPHILTPRFADFFTDFEKKKTILQSTIVPLTISLCVNKKKEDKRGVGGGGPNPP